jgi:hypothetical protein
MAAPIRRNIQVADPDDPGKTLGDVDRIEDGVLWEEKSAVYANDPPAWAERHLRKKFETYLEMRRHLPGFESAPIGFDFVREPQPDLRQEIVTVIERLRADFPDVTIHLHFPGDLHEPDS